MREIYTDKSELWALLKPTTPDLEVCEQAMAAMRASQWGKPDRTKFCDWFIASKAAPNEKEFAGVCRYKLGLRPACVKQLMFAKGGMDFVARWQLDQQHARQWQLMHPWCHDILRNLLRTARHQKEKDMDWLRLNRKYVKLVLAEEDIDAVATAGTAVHTVGQQLTRLVTTGEFGQGVVWWTAVGKLVYAGGREDVGGLEGVARQAWRRDGGTG